MNKKYIVRLTTEERDELAAVIKKLKGTGEKVRRAQILLKADAEGPNWADRRIAEAFGCRIRTVEGIRQRLVEHGFREALDRRRRQAPPVEKLLDGEQEARIIATRLGPPPPGYANWTLRLLARKVVELGIVESVSYETVRRTLKKTRMANLTEAGFVERRESSKEVRHAQATTTAPPTRSRPELGPGHPRLPRVPTPALGPLRQLPHRHDPRRRPPADAVRPTL
jgi:Homeodomain-like domain